MVASALDSLSQAWGFTSQLVPREQLKLTDPDAVDQLVGQSGASLVFHTAALTKVNQCEADPELAQAVNALGTQHVVRAAKNISARLVYFSTDYVFDGSKDSGWLETDTPQPLNEYGKSKLAGEQHVLAYSAGHVVRTSGVFGHREDGKPARNFFQAIASKLQSGIETIPVVCDQYTAVTYAKHLAQMVYSLAGSGMPRLVHLTSSGQNSWYGWAKALTGILGTGGVRLQPVPSKAVDTGTIRPVHCVLKSCCRETLDFIEDFPALTGLQVYCEEAGLSGASTVS